MKNVIRSLIVVLSVICGLMVMGCPTEDDNNEKDDPTNKGRVVEEKYRGKYLSTNNQNHYFVLSENKRIRYDKYDNTVESELFAWTVTTSEGTLLWFRDPDKIEVSWAKFTSDDMFTEIRNSIQWKKETVVGAIPAKYQGKYKLLENNSFSSDSTFTVNLSEDTITQSLEIENHPERTQTFFETKAWMVGNELYIKVNSEDVRKGEFENQFLTVNDVDATLKYVKTI